MVRTFACRYCGATGGHENIWVEAILELFRICGTCGKGGPAIGERDLLFEQNLIEHPFRVALFGPSREYNRSHHRKLEEMRDRLSQLGHTAELGEDWTKPPGVPLDSYEQLKLRKFDYLLMLLPAPPAPGVDKEFVQFARKYRDKTLVFYPRGYLKKGYTALGPVATLRRAGVIIVPYDDKMRKACLLTCCSEVMIRTKQIERLLRK